MFPVEDHKRFLQVAETLRQESRLVRSKCAELREQSRTQIEAIHKQPWYQLGMERRYRLLQLGMETTLQETKALHARLEHYLDVLASADPPELGPARLLSDEIGALLTRARQFLDVYRHLRSIRELPPPASIFDGQFMRSMDLAVAEIRGMLIVLETIRDKYEPGYKVLKRVRRLREEIHRTL